MLAYGGRGRKSWAALASALTLRNLRDDTLVPYAPGSFPYVLGQ